MGLIRSKNTNLTPEDDNELREYLWPIVSEIIKTAVENHQNLVVEGDYIPFDWMKAFDENYLGEIKYYCLVMSRAYIEEHFDDIKAFANAVEKRLDDSWCRKTFLLEQNAYNYEMCKSCGCDYILIDGDYRVDIEL